MKRPLYDRVELGLTLLEMVVVMLILGIMLGVTAVGLSSDTRVKVRNEARMLTNHFREARAQALLSGHTIRYEINLDERQVQVIPLSPGQHPPVGVIDSDTLDAMKEAIGDADDAEGPTPGTFAALEAAVSELESADENLDQTGMQLMSLFSAGDPLTAFSAPPALTPLQLSPDVALRSVWVEGADDLVDEGLAAIHFFPNGETQNALLHLGILNDPSDTVFAIQIDGLSSRTDIREGYQEVPE